MSLSISATKEAGERVGRWIVASIGAKLKGSKLFKVEKVKEAEQMLSSLITKKTGEMTLLSNYWIEVITFMFPDREIDLPKLNENECDYVAQRIFSGLGFEQLLLDAGYKLPKIRYMTHLSGLESQQIYYFDIVASFEQEYFDNFLCARVIDTRVSSPQDYINSIPRAVSDINGKSGRPTLRDHDIIGIVLSNDVSSGRLVKLRQNIRTVQETNLSIPRLILLTDQELNNLLSCSNDEQRSKSIRSKLQDPRLYRGVIE
jgi:hypothetical protein